MHKKYSILMSILIINASLTIYCAEMDTDFAKSFVGAYDFFLQGRDFREYHPFILKKATRVLTQLEKKLNEAQLSIDERIIICGYQQDAISSYFITDENTFINDEYRAKTETGWQNPPSSRMGWLVGYLFKNSLCDDQTCAHFTLKHVGRQQIELFNTACPYLQKHALGNAFDLVTVLSRACMRAIRNKNMHNVLRCIYTLLKLCYCQELADEHGNLFATQDTLFTLYHLKHILQSSIEASTLFIGPDITYPIAELQCQAQEATRNAQTFAKLFTEYILKPKKQKTAYLFCSFVDGVGKSTLFGNIVNQTRFGNNISLYQPVDNASSQSSQIYKLDSTHYLIDLPACMSYIIGKPDGAVYLEPEALNNIATNSTEGIRYYVHTNQSLLIEEHQKGLLLDSFDQKMPLFNSLQKTFASAPFEWVPGSFNGTDFIFNQLNPSLIKILTPLNQVSSRGLKIADPSHMLFNKPYLIPPDPNAFIDNIITQIRAEGIEKIIIVDFISMYPRSSRETIRVNYLLQTIKKIAGRDFLFNASMYAGAAHEQELYLLLKKHRQELEMSFYLEIALRMALFRLIEQYQQAGITQIEQASLYADLEKYFQNLSATEKEQLKQLAHEKIKSTSEHITQKYDHNKILESYLSVNMQEILLFSKFMCNTCTQKIDHPQLTQLWQTLSENIAHLFHQAPSGEGKAQLANGIIVDVVASWPINCRDPLQLRHPLMLLRASWYATLTNLLQCTGQDNCPWHLSTMLPVMPYALVTDSAGTTCFLIRPCFESIEKAIPFTLAPFCNPSIQIPLVHKNGMLLCLDLSCGMAACNHYGYQPDYARTTQQNKTKVRIDILIDQLKNKRHHADDFISTHELVSIAEKHGMLQDLFVANTPTKNADHTACPPQAVQLCVLALATLDLILKDDCTDIMARSYDKEDFIATIKLVEKMSLARLFGMSLTKPLFDDYQQLRPVIPHAFDEINERKAATVTNSENVV